IWLGWTSNCSASCTSVRSPLIAAIATFALKADVWFRRGLLLMLSPDSRANLARCQAEAPLIALCRFPKPALNAVRLHSAQRSASAPISTGSQFGRAHDVSRGSGPVEWYWEIQIQWVDRRGGSRDNNTPTLSWTFGCRADWGD